MVAEDFFQFDEVSERKRRIADAQAAEEVRLKWEAEEAAKLKERLRQFSLKANRGQVLAEYHEAGVKPPFVGKDGYPTVSLALLRWIGWRIEEIVGHRTLVAPAPRPKGSGKRREDYDQSS